MRRLHEAFVGAGAHAVGSRRCHLFFARLGSRFFLPQNPFPPKKNFVRGGCTGLHSDLSHFLVINENWADFGKMANLFWANPRASRWLLESVNELYTACR